MFRELLRSTLYSSSRPPSSKATRVSSFSTLRTSLLPVLREGRPKIFLTLSIIKMEAAAVLVGALPQRAAEKSCAEAEAPQLGQREPRKPQRAALLSPVNLLPVQRRDRRLRPPSGHLRLARCWHSPRHRYHYLFPNRGNSLP